MKKKSTIEICPICDLPGILHYDGGEIITKPAAKGKPKTGCSFFARLQNKKFDGDKAASGKLRCEFFRKYHDDVCGKCLRTVSECLKVKLKSAAYKKAKKKLLEEAEFFGQVEDVKMSSIKCARQRFPGLSEFTLVHPSWWKEHA